MTEIDEARRLPRFRPTAQPSIVDLYIEKAVDPSSPAGKRALRGIPVVGGTSGTQPGTDPLHAVLDKICGCGKQKLPERARCRRCARMTT